MKKVFAALVLCAFALLLFFAVKDGASTIEHTESRESSKPRAQEISTTVAQAGESLAQRERAVEGGSFLEAEPNEEPVAESVSDSLDSLGSDEQQSLWQAFSEARRQVRPIPESWANRRENLGYDFYAMHPKQKLRTRFGPGGAQLSSSSRTHTEADGEDVYTAWEARMHLTHFAGEAVAAGATPVPSAELSSKVEYQHEYLERMVY